MENQSFLLIAHSLIGVGFFFIYIHHVRSIFESRTNVEHLGSQLERETLFRREDALYYGFYKTIVEESDFWTGYEKLSNLTNIEYPHSVNVLKRFEVLPELLIGYFYQNWRYLTNDAPFPYPFTACWRSHDIRMPIGDPYRECDLSSQPMQFYLEMVWLLGGITVFLIYIYGTFLSEHLFGGIYSVVSYFMFHKYASKIYDRPLARENFAFPFIFLQMLYVTTSYGNMMRENFYKNRLINIFVLMWVTSIALVTWQFSSVIFIVQIVVAFVPWAIQTIPLDMYSKFASNLAFSHLLANFLAYILTWGNRKYLYAWTIGPAVGLLAICYSRKMRLKQQQEQEGEEGTGNSVYALEAQPVRFVILGALTASTVQGALVDLVQKWGIAPMYESTFTLYRDLFVHWILPARINFVTSLAACNPHFDRIDLMDLWDLVKTLFVKPYCMYGVVMLAEFFRKWRKSAEKKAPNLDKIERAKKYVLEDFLEENHISMREMSNKETEEDLNKCLKLLEECDFDYDKYKAEKSKLKKSSRNDHDDFLNNIKELKQKINALNSKQSRDKKTHTDSPMANGQEKKKGDEDTASEDQEKEHGERDESSENNPSDTDKNKTQSNDSQNQSDGSSKVDTHTNDAKRPTPNATSNEAPQNKNAKKTKSSNKANKSGSSSRKSNEAQAHTNSSSNAAHSACIQRDNFAMQMTAFHYLHSFVQMGVFTFLGLCFRKLFFLCFTQGCVIAPTICSKWCFRRNRNMFWTISLTVFITSIVNPGIMNIREEYFPSNAKTLNDDLDTMLEWIKLNTERDAVFAGPIEIIGTVHMTTKRPIVNHAHLEMRQILERTEHVYSVYSRQQSSDIYNQYSQMRVQYLIVSLKDCTNVIRYDCDLLQIWDDMQPAYRKYPQFCYELMNKNIPSFLRVFSNDFYSVIKLFSQSVQINLRHSKMPEKVM